MREEPTGTKEDIRASHRARRSGLSGDDVATASEGIARHGSAWAGSLAGGTPATFCVYLGVGVEPPTLPLIEALHRDGHRVLLPVCEPGRELSWVYWSPDVAFIRSRYAPVMEPDGPRHGPDVAAGATALFIPATAVDLAGNRIGQGGGYYDKFLGHLDTAGKHIPLAAVIYDEELLPAGRIHAEEFDRPVPAVLTPAGVRTLAGSS
ncbi:5-formyltetrahydrofolate cyclo-ligase [Pseudarthrobacter enclensis]|uniref:5-formyltetrahydrofolate cyclo-ligase n=1 Tax=Pseudarthrobacter enclensis TaxID=993070 RepID=UPI003EE20E54